MWLDQLLFDGDVIYTSVLQEIIRKNQAKFFGGPEALPLFLCMPLPASQTSKKKLHHVGRFVNGQKMVVRL